MLKSRIIIVLSIIMLFSVGCGVKDPNIVKYGISKVEINEFSEEEQIEIINKSNNIEIFSLIDNPSKRVIDVAFKKDFNAIMYIEKSSDEMQKIALEKDFNILKDIHNPSSLIVKNMVLNDPKLISKILYPSEELQLSIIDIDPFNIKFINNPSEETQFKAINKNVNTIEFIKRPTFNVQKKIFEIDPNLLIKIKYQDIALQKYIISKEMGNVKYINSYNKELEDYIKKINKDRFFEDKNVLIFEEKKCRESALLINENKSDIYACKNVIDILEGEKLSKELEWTLLEANYNLGLIFYKNENYKEALKKFRLVNNKGFCKKSKDCSASKYIGTIYMTGKNGIRKNITNAYTFLTESSENGNNDAKELLKNLCQKYPNICSRNTGDKNNITIGSLRSGDSNSCGSFPKLFREYGKSRMNAAAYACGFCASAAKNISSSSVTGIYNQCKNLSYKVSESRLCLDVCLKVNGVD